MSFPRYVSSGCGDYGGFMRIFAEKRFFILLSGLLAYLPSLGAVTGRVIDKAGNPVAGASVSLDQQKLTTVTDAQGRFTLGTVSVLSGNVKVTQHAAGARIENSRWVFSRSAGVGSAEAY